MVALTKRKEEKMKQVQSPYLTLREADNYLRVRSGSVAKAVHAGDIRASRLPGSRTLHVHMADLDDYARGHTFVPKFQ